MTEQNSLEWVDVDGDGCVLISETDGSGFVDWLRTDLEQSSSNPADLLHDEEVRLDREWDR